MSDREKQEQKFNEDLASKPREGTTAPEVAAQDTTPSAPLNTDPHEYREVGDGVQARVSTPEEKRERASLAARDN